MANTGVHQKGATMAERAHLEQEVQNALSHIDDGDNFLLSGGAGSGKTYSLVQLINQLIKEQPDKSVACITYTNAAVREIEERINHKNLSVSTIHDFLWDNIKHFQKELKLSLINLINDESSRINNPEEYDLKGDYFNSLSEGIQYKEYVNVKNGIISHDEVLLLANYIFENYPRLSDILKDKFRFIFLDEYQDTSPLVVEILLKHLKKSNKKTTIGFFGDSMQSIYENGIGDLNEYKEEFEEVLKKQNRRNPQLIIDLANQIRTDSISQEPSEDSEAPNMKHGKIKEGTITFCYSDNDDIEYIKSKIGWNFDDSKKTKILNLTHNLIAPKAGFKNLMEIYDKDRIIEFKNRIKKYIKSEEIETDFSDMKFGEVLKILQKGKTEKDLAKVSPTKTMLKFIEANSELYKYALKQNYGKFSKIYLTKEALVDDKKQTKDEESKKGSKRDDLIKHLFKIQDNIAFYKSRQFNDFIRKTEYKISSLKDKKILAERIGKLIDVGDKDIGTIIDDAHNFSICRKDEKLSSFIEENNYLFHRVKQVEFSEFQKLYDYLEGYTPFSTQHKTKGQEFDNVLVIVDNGGWNDYNFEKFFVGDGKESVQERTKKIFYVCCTRAKENLAIFYHNPSINVIRIAQSWFGKTSVKNLESTV